MKRSGSPTPRPVPRRLAVGEFDGVHAGHREVIRGADSVLTFEPHPRTVVAPESAPKLLTTLEQKADLIADLGVEELIVIPFDGERMPQTRAGVHRPRAGRAARRDVGLGRRELPLRPPRAGRRRAAARAGRVRDARGRDGRGRRRDRLLDAHPRAGRDRRGRRGGAAARRAVRDARDRRPRRQARAHARLPDRQPRARSGAARSPTTASTPAARPCRAWGSGRRRSRSACARRSSPAAGCWSRRSCSTSTATSTAASCGSQFLDRIRGERRFDSAEALIEQMHRDVAEIARLVCP